MMVRFCTLTMSHWFQRLFKTFFLKKEDFKDFLKACQSALIRNTKILTSSLITTTLLDVFFKKADIKTTNLTLQILALTTDSTILEDVTNPGLSLGNPS